MGLHDEDRIGLSGEDSAHIGHDHSHCSGHAMGAAERLCAARGVRLTDQRRRVLEVLLAAEHVALGAYEILERVVEPGARRPAPMAVYRALDFLQEQGLVHRVSSLNAFLACVRPEDRHAGQLLICAQCHRVGECTAQAVDVALDRAAADRGFTVSTRVVELLGTCASCTQAEAA